MAYYAKVINGLVTEVIRADEEFVKSIKPTSIGKWIQTSYNTYGGVHPEGKPLRKNYAGVGFTYDKQKDAFIPPQPFKSWVLDPETCLWNPPFPPPDETPVWRWDEDTISWVDITE